VPCSPPNYCHTASCDSTNGCTINSITCTATNACNTVFADPTNPTCCVNKAINCTGTDLCRSYFCDPITGCNSTYKCNIGNKCNYDICTPAGCKSQSTNCAAPDLCTTGTCNPLTGCEFVVKDCNDNDNCTVDTCEATTGQCVNTKKNCDDLKKCTMDTCEAITGQCVNTMQNCNDGFDCTVDGVCDESTGLCPTKVAQHQMCGDANPCKIWTCDLTAGCLSSDRVCETAGLDACTSVKCIDWINCTKTPKVCVFNKTGDKDCTTAFCDTNFGNCTYVAQPCAVLDTSVVIAAALSSAALVGIILAIVACLGLGGGATYAAVIKYNGDELATTQNNPLFSPAGRDKTNPLYRT